VEDGICITSASHLSCTQSPCAQLDRQPNAAVSCHGGMSSTRVCNTLSASGRRRDAPAGPRRGGARLSGRAGRGAVRGGRRVGAAGPYPNPRVAGSDRRARSSPRLATARGCNPRPCMPVRDQGPCTALAIHVRWPCTSPATVHAAVYSLLTLRLGALLNAPNRAMRHVPQVQLPTGSYVLPARKGRGKQGIRGKGPGCAPRQVEESRAWLSAAGGGHGPGLEG